MIHLLRAETFKSQLRTYLFLSIHDDSLIFVTHVQYLLFGFWLYKSSCCYCDYDLFFSPYYLPPYLIDKPCHQLLCSQVTAVYNTNDTRLYIVLSPIFTWLNLECLSSVVLSTSTLNPDKSFQ